ncbi:hypothetical protein [Hoeflea sp.]|uniref:hypothetical protein n=1 Tax=Hoeflea sp. TaxID=1940281 RepID=UPI003A8FEBD6
MLDRKNVNIEEERVVQTWIAISTQKGRDLSAKIYQGLREIEDRGEFRISNEFIDWSVRHLNESQLEEMKNHLILGIKSEYLLKNSGVYYGFERA